MAQLVSPGKTKIKLVPKDGELEITVNINITVDGQISASVAENHIEEKPVKKETNYFVPDFSSGAKLNFGKEE